MKVHYRIQKRLLRFGIIITLLVVTSSLYLILHCSQYKCLKHDVYFAAYKILTVKEKLH